MSMTSRELWMVVINLVAFFEIANGGFCIP